MRSAAELSKALRTVIAAKQSGNEDTPGRAGRRSGPGRPPQEPPNFNVDNVRVVKIMGGSLEQSTVVKGMVLAVNPMALKSARHAKVGVFSCPIDILPDRDQGYCSLEERPGDA